LATLFLLAGPLLSQSVASQQPQSPAPGGGLRPCQATQVISSGDSLTSLADFYFGDSQYAPSVLLATNGRSGTDGFSFIRDPQQLPTGAPVCIPDLAEAERLRLRYEEYLRAVREMVLPQIWQVSSSLLAIDPTKPMRVVAWVRTSQVEQFTGSTAAGPVWVTEARPMTFG
jgi:hypothetical protein